MYEWYEANEAMQWISSPIQFEIQFNFIQYRIDPRWLAEYRCGIQVKLVRENIWYVLICKATEETFKKF